MYRRRKIVFGVALAIIAVICILAFWPSKTQAVDVVNGVTPVSTALGDIRVTLAELAQMPVEQRETRLRQEWPNLEESVVYFLRQRDRLPRDAEVERVRFFFGSMDNVRAVDGDGNMHEGYFRDQLVARVDIRGHEKPIDVIVQCLNGVMSLPEDLAALQPLGTATPEQRFTIGPREGLVHHVDYPVAIDLAQRFNLPLYRGQHMTETARITPDQARQLEPMTDRVQVTVQVYEGDTFDLMRMSFTPSSRRP